MLEQTKLDELKAQLPGVKLHELSYEDASIVVRAPSRMEFRKWKAEAAEDAKKLDAPESLLLACTVHPRGEDLEALFDAQPGLVDTFALQVLNIAGFSMKAEKKAL